MAQKLTASEILAMTLRPPTARLSESEAADRAEEIRQRSHYFPHGSNHKGLVQPTAEFKRDWSRMMRREGGVE